ncbi:MAG: hypothetical protein PHC51_09545 [bacterium]|nr:hypothetical protein [bacterium]
MILKQNIHQRLTASALCLLTLWLFPRPVSCGNLEQKTLGQEERQVANAAGRKLGEELLVIDHIIELGAQPEQAMLMILNRQSGIMTYQAHVIGMDDLIPGKDIHRGSNTEKSNTRFHTFCILDRRTLERFDGEQFAAAFIFTTAQNSWITSEPFFFREDELAKRSLNSLVLSQSRKAAATLNQELESQISEIEESLFFHIGELYKAGELKSALYFRNLLQSNYDNSIPVTGNEWRLKQLLLKEGGHEATTAELSQRNNLVLLLEKFALDTSTALRTKERREKEQRNRVLDMLRVAQDYQEIDTTPLMKELVELTARREQLEARLAEQNGAQAD